MAFKNTSSKPGSGMAKPVQKSSAKPKPKPFKFKPGTEMAEIIK
jgi:hypothetical protein